MGELTYEDFKRRVNIQDLLTDAGYRLTRRDGLRYPSYVRVGLDVKRVHGDKFIVTGNGLCCFQPPERKNYNVISFIKEHPHFFAEYTPGMSKDRLVNLVCNRILNQPVSNLDYIRETSQRSNQPFNIGDYKIQRFDCGDWESQKKFCSYFINRGINLQTQRTFSGTFFLTTKERTDGKSYTNLAFPLSKAVNPGKDFVGLEERSRPNAEGKTAYKGMAAGSNASEGMWIARLEKHRSDKEFTTPISEVHDVYWFESAFDAMAYYQLHYTQLMERLAEYDRMRDTGEYKGDAEIEELKSKLDELGRSVFVSTGGNPSNKQFSSLIGQIPQAAHHLCFDRDKVGETYCVNFALLKAGRVFTSHLSKSKSKLLITDLTNQVKRYEPSMEPFDFYAIGKALDIEEWEHPLETYMQSLTKIENAFSGDYELLPKDLYRLYGKYESAVEEYCSAKCSGLVCSEDLEDLRNEAERTGKTFSDGLKVAIADYKANGRTGRMIYEPCHERYKDWNDELMQKPFVQDMEQEKEQQPHFRR